MSRKLSRAELAEQFGVDDPDQVADGLYDEYLAYVDADFPMGKP